LFEKDDFLSARECEQLVALIDADRVPSTIFEARDEDRYRTSETCWMDHSIPLVQSILARIAALLDIDPSHGEQMQGQRYGPGQYYKPHCDFIRVDRPHWRHQREMGGQRTWTAMIYLNEPGGGGETHFPHAALQVAPRAGRLLAWNNLGPDGAPNEQSLHEGRPVTAGSKYIVTQWFRERPCRRPGWRAAVRRYVYRQLSRLRRVRSFADDPAVAGNGQRP
jgi:prolyl 4-hydroxylase